MLFRSNDTATTEIYTPSNTLSLHDALPFSLDKIRRLRELRAERNLSFRIEVDGGVAHNTVAAVVEAGAELLVAGSAVFDGGQPERKARELLEAARSAELASAR